MLSTVFAKVTRDPRSSWTPLPFQHRFLTSVHPRRLLRAGNQLGKTTAGAEDLISYVTGFNPWSGATFDQPVEAWVVCSSWQQSIAVQRKLFEQVPQDLFHPSTVFDEIQGFSPIKSPAVRIRHVSGGYSLVRIKTLGQGPLRLSSATIQYVWIDEPPNQASYAELLKRVQRAGSKGRIILTLTPVNADVEWLETLCESGAIEDHHQRLEESAMIPLLPVYSPVDLSLPEEWTPGKAPLTLDDGTPCDSAWIAKTIEETPAYLRDVRCHGEWSGVPEGAVFTGFRTTGTRSHVIDYDPPEDLRLFVGIDHGVKQYTQIAVLIGMDSDGNVYVLDEYVGDHETTDDNDADGILSMLERCGLGWFNLDEVHGDRAHYGQGKGQSVAAKSNQRLTRAILRVSDARRRVHRIGSRDLVPPIRRAKSGVSARAGSVEFGCDWLHRRMVSSRFFVNRRCKHGISSLLGYGNVQNSPESHWVDALRYGLRTPIWRADGVQRRGATLRLRG